jgi:hypothetical protein
MCMGVMKLKYKLILLELYVYFQIWLHYLFIINQTSNKYFFVLQKCKIWFEEFVFQLLY